MDDNKIIRDFEDDAKLNIEKVIKTYNTYIYTVLKNSIASEEDIQEILSDVFFIFWKKADALEKDIKVKSYLIGITRNLIKKKYAHYNIDYEFESFDDIQNELYSNIDVINNLETANKIEIVEEVLNSIKDQEKEIFIMFYYQNKKVKDIAKKLNISVSKVKVTLHRLRKLAKKKLKERGYNYGK